MKVSTVTNGTLKLVTMLCEASHYKTRPGCLSPPNDICSKQGIKRYLLGGKHGKGTTCCCILHGSVCKLMLVVHVTGGRRER